MSTISSAPSPSSLPPAEILRRRCGVARDWAGVGSSGALRFPLQLVEYALVSGHVRSEAVRLYDRILRQRLLAVAAAQGTVLDQIEVPSEGAVWSGEQLQQNLEEASRLRRTCDEHTQPSFCAFARVRTGNEHHRTSSNPSLIGPSFLQLRSGARDGERRVRRGRRGAPAPLLPHRRRVYGGDAPLEVPLRERPAGGAAGRRGARRRARPWPRRGRLRGCLWVRQGRRAGPEPVALDSPGLYPGVFHGAGRGPFRHVAGRARGQPPPSETRQGGELPRRRREEGRGGGRGGVGAVAAAGVRAGGGGAGQRGGAARGAERIASRRKNQLAACSRLLSITVIYVCFTLISTRSRCSFSQEEEALVAASRCRSLAAVIRQDLAAAVPHLRLLCSPARVRSGFPTDPRRTLVTACVVLRARFRDIPWLRRLLEP